ncbi:MAG: MFS transporter [Planctomycetes bacterium]|nr:MFS transporter [Planctomycetota bacterium]
MDASRTKRSFWGQICSFPGNFWSANVMETFERLAFYSVRAIAPLYLVASSGQNGLGLDYSQKGIIYSVWAILQCLVPMVSGGYTERYGYRKSLAVAFVINILGYSGMALSKPIADSLSASGWSGAGFWVFMVAAGLVGIGTAIFKPPVHGTIAKTTDEETSSLGWGVFYWVVNIGGALGPMVAAILRVEIDWDNVFYFAAGVTAANFLPAFLLYKEPEKTPAAEGSLQTKGVVGVFTSSVVTVFRDARLVVFLGIFSCFWLMFMQLWDLLPNFIDEWVDSSDVAPLFAWFSKGWVLESGQTKPEMIINLDAISIILLVIPLSWLVGRISKVAAMIIGMAISLVAFVAAGATMVGWFCCAMVLVFSIGEMACSPTFSAYVGLIAPRDKKALYMGYSNIPYAIGWTLGGLIGGFVYDNCGAKSTLALKYLAPRTELIARAAQAADWSDALDKIPPLLGIDRDKAFELAQSDLETTAESAATILGDDFKFDRGQIENLALQHLALDETYRDRTVEGFVRLMKDRSKELDERVHKFGDQVLASQKPAEQQPNDNGEADKSSPTAAEVITGTENLKATAVRVEELASGKATVDNIRVGTLVHLLPGIVGQPRGSAFDAVRNLVNKDVPPREAKTDTEITELLWDRFGRDPDVLNNLALEYLAQSTDRVHNAVANMTFEHTPEELQRRIAEIQKRIGISRAKSFASLSAVLGGDEAAVDQVLSNVEVATGRETDRLYVYLMQQPQHRLTAIGQKDWRNDRHLLREVIRSDPDALETVLEGIDNESWLDHVTSVLTSIFTSGEDVGEVTEEGVNYYKLARKKELIQQALAVKNWAQTPDQAARLLGLNPFEARALVGANLDQARQVLWDTFDPFLVWYYLGGVGLLGTIGMILFYVATKGPKREETSELEAA